MLVVFISSTNTKHKYQAEIFLVGRQLCGGFIYCLFQKQFINYEQEKIESFSLLNNSGDPLSIIILVFGFWFFFLTVLLLRQNISIWEGNDLGTRVPDTVNFCLVS